jgi:hypothetical protein
MIVLSRLHSKVHVALPMKKHKNLFYFYFYFFSNKLRELNCKEDIKIWL